MGTLETAPDNATASATAPRRSSWRADIQGLRAVAVLAVVAFHAGLPLPGGFVGVDVFFVISGFVITAMLGREFSRAGRIDFRAFYLRRLKRLTPALSVVVAVTLVLSALLLSPFGAQQLTAATGQGAMLLNANWVIASSTQGYFDADAETNPLLNTWSLSVEEQFYLVFPALLLLGWVLGRRIGWRRVAPIAVVAVVALASVAMLRGAVIFGADSWWVGFYSPLNRAWEFAAGALLALVLAGWSFRLSRWLALVVGVLGSLMLGASLLLINESTPFPGKWTFLPVTATVLLILAGQHRQNPVSRLLSTAAMVRVGDWSYSLYLWHWPLIVLAVELWPGTPWAPLVTAVVSVLPAVASYRWIEQPIRKWPVQMDLPARVGLAGFVVVPVALAIAVAWTATNVWAPAYRSGAIPAQRFETAASAVQVAPCPLPRTNELAARYGDSMVRCLASKTGAAPTVALLGDSHAGHLFTGMAEQLPDDNVLLVANFGQAIDPSQQLYQEMVSELALQPSIRTVVIGNYWSDRGVSAEGLDSVVTQLEAAGKTVVLVNDVPDFGFDPVQCEYRKAPVLPWEWCQTSAPRLLEERADDRAVLTQVASRHPEALLVDAFPFFCDELVCRMDRGSDLLYRDQDHLNDTGSRYLVERLLADPRMVRALKGQGAAR